MIPSRWRSAVECESRKWRFRSEKRLSWCPSELMSPTSSRAHLLLGAVPRPQTASDRARPAGDVVEGALVPRVHDRLLTMEGTRSGRAVDRPVARELLAGAEIFSRR